MVPRRRKKKESKTRELRTERRRQAGHPRKAKDEKTNLCPGRDVDKTTAVGAHIVLGCLQRLLRDLAQASP